PPGKAEGAVEPQQRGRNRPAERHRDRRRYGEPGDHPPSVAGRKPVVEIKQDPGKKTGLGGAKQKAQGHKADRTTDKRHRPGKEAPGDHDAGEPERGADLFEKQVARHFEKAVTAVKRSRAEPEEVGAKAEIL